MFTGLIEATGRLVDRCDTGGGVRIRIESALAAELSAGDSVAVNGVCLTAIVADRDAIHADLGPETVRVTTLGTLMLGAAVNLERPLRADSRFGGHFVQGHVDGIGCVEGRRAEAAFEWFTVSFPGPLAPYFVAKGSIAVDGISLTVAGLGRDRFDVQIVPYTLEHTNLSGLQVRDRVNLECDMVGKYVVRAAELAGLMSSGAGHGTYRNSEFRGVENIEPRSDQDTK
jgi:riboflavin synthase